MTPVCTNCRISMRCRKNDAIWITYTPYPNGALRPCFVWMCDCYRCPRCANSILTGFGKAPIKTYQAGDNASEDIHMLSHNDPTAMVIHEDNTRLKND